jgi:hypothetical protein
VLTGPDNSIHILTQRGLRHLVFTAAGDYVRERTLPIRAVDAIVRDDGLLVLSAPAEIGGSVKALHVISPAGGIQNSFGEVVPAPSIAQAATMVLGRSAGGRTWAVPFGKYELQLVSRVGGVVQRVSRPASWFREESALSIPGATPAVPSQVLGVFHHSPRYLWVVAAVSDLSWRPSAGGVALQQDRVFDTMIEVIDLQEGRLVASRRFDELFQVGREGFLYRVAVSSAGSAAIELVMPDLRGLREGSLR